MVHKLLPTSCLRPCQTPGCPPCWPCPDCSGWLSPHRGRTRCPPWLKAVSLSLASPLARTHIWHDNTLQWCSKFSSLQTCRAWSRYTWRRMPGCLQCLPCRGKTRESQEAHTSSWQSCPAAFSSSGFHNLCGQVWNRYVNKYLCRWPVSCSKIRGQQGRGNRQPSLTWLSLRKRERGREFVHLQRPTKTSKRQKNLTSTTKLSKPIIRYN